MNKEEFLNELLKNKETYFLKLKKSIIDEANELGSYPDDAIYASNIIEYNFLIAARRMFLIGHYGMKNQATGSRIFNPHKEMLPMSSVFAYDYYTNTNQENNEILSFYQEVYKNVFGYHSALASMYDYAKDGYQKRVNEVLNFMEAINDFENAQKIKKEYEIIMYALHEFEYNSHYNRNYYFAAIAIPSWIEDMKDEVICVNNANANNSIIDNLNSEYNF